MRLDYKDCGKIGITCSTFDLLHAGHVVMLEEAKRHCDYLIAALQVDPTLDRDTKNKPIQSIVERQIQLAAVKYVDEIVMYSTENELEDLFQICLDRNIELFYNVRDHSFSSTSLRQRIQSNEIEKITGYKDAVMPEVVAANKKRIQDEKDNSDS